MRRTAIKFFQHAGTAVIIGLLGFALLAPVFAHEGEDPVLTPAEHREEQEEAREAERAERQEQREEAREERREALSERLRDRVENLWDRIENRFDNAFDRFDSIIERLESRIADFEERFDGLDGSAARAEIAEARENLTLAEGALADARVTFDEALEAEHPRQALGGVREHIGDAMQYLRDARTDLQEAIRALTAELPDVSADDGDDEMEGEDEQGGE